MTANVPDPTPLTDTDLAQAITRAIAWSDATQRDDGYWNGMLQSNCCMEAQWVMMQWFLGIENDSKYKGVVQTICNEQRDDGAWEIYYDAPMGDMNTTVECYAALVIAGHDKQSEPLVKARKWILEHGGLSTVRVFTRYWLALIGEWPWDKTPQLPPELIFLPTWAPFNIYQFAQWGRATIVPLCVLSARRPARSLPADRRLDELFPEGRDNFKWHLDNNHPFFSLENFFMKFDRVLAAYVNSPWHPRRETAIKLCLEWIIKHQDADGAWGGIQPPWIYSIMALCTEGYQLNHPVVHKGLDAWNHHWSYQRNGGIFLQASESPVWDTLLTMLGQLECDVDWQQSPTMQKAYRRILDEQVKVPGDWSGYLKNVKPGGWAFESQNDQYPDTDDTAVALLVLAKLRKTMTDTAEIDAAIDLGRDWLVAMQSDNGGWGAFDKNNNSALITKIPFCDFGEVLDPPSVDVTAHAVEALCALGWDQSHPVVRRALDYMLADQEPDGSWFGRWGVNHVYGTGAVLPALAEAGVDMSRDHLKRAARWLVNHQNDDGGWGETCASYMDPSLRGKGPSTASQTAWALMGLLAMGCHDYDHAIRRGLEYLIAHQHDGTWDEPQYTGTGFPGYGLGARTDLSDRANTLDQGTELSRGFMINYNLYRHYFPLTAMGRAYKHLFANGKGA